ncbi:MAG TPA: glycosyltransferase family 39 protein [Phnomibacter sp.]|nr:glycosyltransferase family 39 protein [Phnomibacter sp.]
MYTHTYYQRLFLWLLALFAFIVLFRLGAAPVYILDEAKNVQCAREMWENNTWVVPTFNGVLRTDKPALHYWFMHISFSFFGVGAWQARLFGALLGIGTIWISFYFVKRFSNASQAFFTALVLALSTHFIFEFRLAVPDPYLIFFTTLGVFAGFAYLQEKKTGWLLLAAASLALATLAKGPVALGLPGICLLLLVVLRKHWWVLKDARLLLAAVLYAAIAVPWYWLVHKATNGAFTQGFFFEHNLSRFSSEMEGHGGPFFITLMIVLVGLLPFMVNIVETVRRLWGKRLSDIVLLGVVVSVVYILFFTISSTKLPNYPMPCYPFAAILLGYMLHECMQKRAKWPMAVWWVLLVIAIALPIAGYIAIGLEPGVAGYKWLALGLAVLPICIILSMLAKRRGLEQQMKWLVLGYLLFNGFILGWAYPGLYSQNPVSQLLPTIQKGKNFLVAYKDFNPAFLFNSTNPGFRIQQFSDTVALKKYCETQQQQGVVYIISRTDKLGELNPKQFVEVDRKRDLFEIPTTVLLTWKPDSEN